MRVLFVSKPISAPLHDGSQCLVRDIATHLVHAQPRVMGVNGAPYPFERTLPKVEVLPVYTRGSRFQPRLLDNGRALAHLATDFTSDLWHFVFAPNPRTSRVLRALRRWRNTPALQTVASPPKDFQLAKELLFGDRVVVQSDWTRRRLLEHAPPGTPIEVIHPAAPELSTPEEAAVAAVRARLALPADAEVVVYPGDLEWSGGADHFARLIEQLGASRPETFFVYACRAKTEAAARIEQGLRSRLAGHQVRFSGELPSLLPLLALSRLVLFPTEAAFGKVDIPIALLEAMRLSVPVLSFAFGPLVELGGTVTVPERDSGALLETARALLASPAERARVAAAQHAFLAAECSPKDVAARYERLYQDMLRS